MRPEQLPYDKQALEALAALLMGVALNTQGITWRDRGEGAQIHDFDLIIDDAVVPVEVASANDELHLSALAALHKHQRKVISVVRDWSLILSLSADVRVSELPQGLGSVLAKLETDGVASIDPHLRSADAKQEAIAAELAQIGVTEAFGVRVVDRPGSVTIHMRPTTNGGPSSVTDAVELVATRSDNETKLAKAGSGDLFVWIGDSDPAHLAFWDPTAVSGARPPELPDAVRYVWAGQLFAHTNADGEIVVSCGGLWRAGRNGVWEDLTSRVPHEGLSVRDQVKAETARYA